MARTVSSFSVTADGKGDYLLNFEDEDGETLELTASYEQLDLISEAISEALDADEDDALGVDDDADEEIDE
ncbi:hypothetical protein FPZ54_14935 [Sphingomonas suaedae]|uniref:Uncharacterized protein n=1 Tax=Sphingomonas suaedae TaxID=2599297 RepID=A0A518RIB3_9SPHN|nr:hypothetical protein [Sphingomonas suaedae]QDX27169.1 hypothetical protein FPZ54_14935 [Sphingomonas suaedae]